MDQSSYDFIMNQSAGLKNTAGAGGSKKRRIIIVVAGALALITLAFILFSVLTSGQKNTSEIIAPVAAAQADIIDLTELGAKSAHDLQLINQTTNVNLIITTHHTATTSYLGKNATKLMAPYRNNDFEQQLTAAESSGTFDKTYKALLTNRLDLYRQTLVTAFNQTKSNKLKKQLETYYSQTDTLKGKQATPN